MNPSVSLDDFAKRPMRYWSPDGLPDLLLGLMMVVPGVIFLIAEVLPKSSSWAQVYSFGAPWVWLGCVLMLVRWFKVLKERVTAPRTGYVALPDRTKPGKVLLFVFVIVFGNGLYLLLRHSSQLYGPAIAVLMAVALLFGGFQYKLPHMIWLGLFTVILGACIYPFVTGVNAGLCVLIGLGAAMALTGAWRLRSFLKANPKPEEPPA